MEIKIIKKRRKITIEFLREDIAKRGWELLSDIYQNPKSILKIKCDKEHIFETSYDSYRKLIDCPCCYTKNKKIPFDKINEAAINKGWSIIEVIEMEKETNYKCLCDKKHEIIVNRHAIMSDTSCLKCLYDVDYDYEKVKNVVNNIGWELLSSEYVDKYLKLDCRCDKGHFIQRSLYRILNNPVCTVCRPSGIKLTYEFVKEYIEKYGWKLLEDHYESVHEKMKMICPNECEVFQSFSQFKRRVHLGIYKTCPNCSTKGQSEMIIKNFLNENTDYKWLSIFPKWLKYNKRTCELDLYCEELKFAIEVQGKQHYEFPHKFHSTKEDFDQAQLRDQFKRDKCKEVGVTLIEIRALDFYHDVELMLAELKRQLFNHNIKLNQE